MASRHRAAAASRGDRPVGGRVGLLPRLEPARGQLSSFFAGWYGMQAVRLQHGNAGSPWHDLDDGAPIDGTGDLPEEELRANRMDPVAEFRARELDDRWWRERSADFDRIEVPLLSGANRGGNALHLRGNVEAYVRSASRQKWLEIHGGNHRDDYYLPPGEELHRQFFDHFLKGEDNGWNERLPVMLKIRSVEDTFEPRAEQEWPLARSRWTKLYLDAGAGSLSREPSSEEAATSFDALGDGLRFRLAFDEGDRADRAARREALRLVLHDRCGPVRDPAGASARRLGDHLLRLLRPGCTARPGLAAGVAPEARPQAEHRLPAIPFPRREAAAHARGACRSRFGRPASSSRPATRSSC